MRGKAGKEGFGAGRMGDVGKESCESRRESERDGKGTGKSRGRSQVRAEESRKRFRRGSERVRKGPGVTESETG